MLAQPESASAFDFHSPSSSVSQFQDTPYKFYGPLGFSTDSPSLFPQLSLAANPFSSPPFASPPFRSFFMTQKGVQIRRVLSHLFV